jgi:dynein assembly factor 2
MTENLKKKFEELNMTSEEMERFTEAMKKEEFRKLLFEYAQEISDPKNREIYEREIAQLEQERGMDVQFIHPEPGFCLKTIQNGQRKCFINICKNSNIEAPKSEVQRDPKTNRSGLCWHIPHVCSQPREDLDKSGKQTCTVYDVIFNPDAYRMGETNQRFNLLLKDTAIETIERNFNVTLDKVNMKVLKNLPFKGKPTASMLRKPNSNSSSVKNSSDAKNNQTKPTKTTSENDDPIAPIVNQIKQQYLDSQTPTSNKNKPATAIKSETDVNNNSNSNRYVSSEQSQFTTPVYKLVHRGQADIQDCAIEKSNFTVNSTRPKELLVNIELPLCKTSENLKLDIFEKRLYLESNSPNYKLDLNLPYPVNEKDSKAKFDKSKRCLNVTLPVVPFVAKLDIVTVDNSEDECSNESASFSNQLLETSTRTNDQSAELNLDTMIIPSSSSSSASSSLSASPVSTCVKYTLPTNIKINEFKNIICLRLSVPNYNKNSIEFKVISESNMIVKCESSSPGGYVQYYNANIKFYREEENGAHDDLVIIDHLSLKQLDKQHIIKYVSGDVFEIRLKKTDKLPKQQHVEKEASVIIKKASVSSGNDIIDHKNLIEIDIDQQLDKEIEPELDKADKKPKEFLVNMPKVTIQTHNQDEDLDEDDDPMCEQNVQHENDDNDHDEHEEDDEENEHEQLIEEKMSSKSLKSLDRVKFVRSVSESSEEKIDEEASEIKEMSEFEKDFVFNDDEDMKTKQLSSSSSSSSSCNGLKGILKKPRSFSESESTLNNASVSRTSFCSSDCTSIPDEMNQSCKKSVSFNKQVIKNVFKTGSTISGMKKPNTKKNQKKNKRKRTSSDPSHDASAHLNEDNFASSSNSFMSRRSVSESSDDGISNSTESLNENHSSIGNNQSKQPSNQSTSSNGSSKKSKKKKKNAKKGNSVNNSENSSCAKNELPKQSSNIVINSSQKDDQNKENAEYKNPLEMETLLQWKARGDKCPEDEPLQQQSMHKTKCAFKFKNTLVEELDD